MLRTLQATVLLLFGMIPICRADSITGVDLVQLTTDGSSVSFVQIFSGVPDFTDTDAYGRQADAFQFYIEYASDGGNPLNPYSVDAIVSGANIASLGDITVQNAPTSNFGPGGWGSVVDQAPYTLTALPCGEEVLFEVPLSILGAPNDTFQYAFETFNYGATSFGCDAVFPGAPCVMVTPEPGSVFLAGMGLAGMGLAGGLLVRRRSSRAR